MLWSTTAPSSQSFTTCPSAALAVPGLENITASGGSVHTRTHAAFCITARESTWACAIRPMTVTRCCGQLWSGHDSDRLFSFAPAGLEGCGFESALPRAQFVELVSQGGCHPATRRRIESYS